MNIQTDAQMKLRHSDSSSDSDYDTDLDDDGNTSI